jgi:hypothetical protein
MESNTMENGKTICLKDLESFTARRVYTRVVFIKDLSMGGDYSNLQMEITMRASTKMISFMGEANIFGRMACHMWVISEMAIWKVKALGNRPKATSMKVNILRI